MKNINVNFMITSGRWHFPLGRGPSALLCLGAYNAVKTALQETPQEPR